MFNRSKDQMKEQQDGRQYEYAKEQQKDSERPALSNKEFVFSFAKNKQISQKLKSPRSRAYMDIFAAIDMLSTTDEEIIEKIKADMDEETAEEFSEMSAEELLEELVASMREEMEAVLEEMQKEQTVLIGVLSKCYIDGCDVHAIDDQGSIIEHYETGSMINNERLEIGRRIFHKYPECTCVEVYNHFCLVINPDSSVTEIQA